MEQINAACKEKISPFSPENLKAQKNKFYLNKWYLDFHSNEGLTAIFYATRLWWRNIEIPYSSCLIHEHEKCSFSRQKLKPHPLPLKNGNLIQFKNRYFKIEGSWLGQSLPIDAEIYKSSNGNLNWHCIQPVSKVTLNLKDKILGGTGYAEQLILTQAPWEIPMNQLRWGHFVSSDNNIVWIKLTKQDKQWLWLNSHVIQNAVINDDEILLPEYNLKLKLKEKTVLESENKIMNLMKLLMKSLPGFKKIMPLKFLMAKEIKWFTKANLYQNEKLVSKGWAIHEFVDFNTL